MHFIDARFIAAVGVLVCCGCDDNSAASGRSGSTEIDATAFVPPALSDMSVVSDATVDAIPLGDAGPDAACLNQDCDDGFACEVDAGEAICVPLSCDDLACGELERCEVNDAGGAVCVDLRCRSDLDCNDDEFCNEICVADVCNGGSRRCVGDIVTTCLEDGSGELASYPCGSEGTGFGSVCVEAIPGRAVCTCRDNWDCPGYMRCEAGACTGRPDPATCQLDPVAFTESLPTVEITWGGGPDSDELAAVPFGGSSQAVMTPLIANLDDDNGDGLIDARDFPEIIFLTFNRSLFTANGVLRAISGGGPTKGQDHFAILGDRLWQRGDPLPEEGTFDYDDADLDSTASPAVADLDPIGESDGKPEIVAVTQDDGLVIYDHQGRKLTSRYHRALQEGPNPAISIANIDQEGFAEIIVGRSVFSVGRNAMGELRFLDRWTGALNSGRNSQGAISCVGDVVGLGTPQIIAGPTVYHLPAAPVGANRPEDCRVNGGLVDANTQEEDAWCAQELIVLWRARDVNGMEARTDGFCAVADILGGDQSAAPSPQNPLDGEPEVIVVGGGRVQIFNGQTGRLLRNIALRLGDNGGAPNVDDFDGDGFPEIGSAFSSGYAMVDLQEPTANCGVWDDHVDDEDEAPVVRTPGDIECQRDDQCTPGESVCNVFTEQCVCLHNGWKRSTEDNSSRVTGSTLFDFNGDGAAEVIYNDECWFRIYDGTSGRVLLKEPSESRTRIEYPVVADVDNDGNAEIIFTTSTESGFCSERSQDARPPREGQWRDHYNSGVEVWGDPNDRWVSARRIWNQHSYHITQITEDGLVPINEPPSWQPLNGRIYNTYRSQPRSSGVAPDLVIAELHVSSPGDGCGELTDEARLTALVRNEGDLRVGPGVVLRVFGEWMPGLVTPLSNGDGSPVETTLQTPLDPGATIRISVDYNASEDPGHSDGLPARFIAKIDAGGDPEFGRERECREGNNDASVVVVAPAGVADLTIDEVILDAGFCPSGRLSARVTNSGQRVAQNIAVHFYAGDPARGGTLLAETLLDAPLEPGMSRVVEAETNGLPTGSPVTPFAVVDPADAIEECSENDNLARGPAVACRIP
jgi:hypothetical protein